MDPHRVKAPVTTPAAGLRGPASYFPSIEEKYGQPMQHWIDLTVQSWKAGVTHMEIVRGLKTEHGLGHGHANAIVAYVKAELAD